jgi:hypothetical protein
MKLVVKVMLLAIIFVSAAEAQTKVVSFKKLKEFLPSVELPGFEKKKAEGSSQSAMGYATSEASVRYVSKDTAGSENAPQVEISVRISDMSAIPGATLAFAYLQDFEKETEDGYEKGVTINKTYKGREQVRNAEDSKSCTVDFAVGTRYMINISMDGSDDTRLVYSLIDSMKLADLEKLLPEETK